MIMNCEGHFLCQMVERSGFWCRLKSRVRVPSSGSLGMVIRPKWLDPTICTFCQNVFSHSQFDY